MLFFPILFRSLRLCVSARDLNQRLCETLALCGIPASCRNHPRYSSGQLEELAMARLSILIVALIAQVTLLYAEDTDVIERTDGKTIPPLTITHDDYLHVIGKHVIEYKVPAYAVKDVAYGGG